MKDCKECLKEALELELRLYLKTWTAHWNITGKNFGELHRMFGDQYEKLQEFVDEIAERLRQLEETVKMPASMAIPVAPTVSELKMSHRVISNKLIRTFAVMANDVGDLGTMDMFIKMAQWHDKQAWFLESSE